MVSQMRASFFAIGPLLARCGVAEMPLPGGCAIGARPVDLHVRGLQTLGAEVTIESGVVHAAVPGNRRLQGAAIHLDYPSVGATRSEEHTSELQSLTNLVCRLLLEKKNK